jgi:hypothetical protein
VLASRRPTIRFTPAQTAALVGVVVLLSSAVGLWAQRAPRKDVGAELARLAERYAIDIVADAPAFPVKTEHGVVDGKPAKHAALQAYATLFIPEFSLYPPDLVKRAQLKRIVLCEDLTFADQRRGAIPEYGSDTLYLDVSRGNYSPSYLRKVIHHEFFHIIDYKDDGKVYADEQWAALNAPGFKYGGGGKSAQGEQNASILTDKVPGFLTMYATTGVEEDKAEMFANLLVNFANVEKRGRKDKILAAKAERMRELLTEFCPEMNEAFWNTVRTMKRNNDRPEAREE